MSSKKPSAESGQESDGQFDSVQREGAHRADFEGASSFFATVDRPELVDDGVTVDVSATHYEDDHDDSVVTLTAAVVDERVSLTLSPPEARSLARQLGEAAKFADEGEPEEGSR